MDMIFTGISSSERRATDEQVAAIKSLVAEAEQKRWDAEELRQAFNKQSQIVRRVTPAACCCCD